MTDSLGHTLLRRRLKQIPDLLVGTVIALIVVFGYLEWKKRKVSIEETDDGLVQ